MESPAAKQTDPAEASAQPHFRPDIQGLRAVAVVLVMIFHFWPKDLTGGYIGVDVFFVISGYLITGILMRELEASEHILFWNFYSRRIKRLVPCATFVLVMTGALSAIFLPATQWRSTAHGILASAFYVENWDLIHKSANYLNAFFPPTPVQHFWSLSVEGQFYVFWPLVLIFTDRLILKGRRRGIAPILVFSTIAVLSFIVALIICYQASVPAYFSTITRIWELALGGVVIFLDRTSASGNAARSLAFGWLGILAIMVAGVSLSNQTLFPGYAALLPTCGAALVILAGGTDHRLSVSRCLAVAPLRYIGDISYSMYLWHWPILLFAKEIVGPSIGPLNGALLFVLCIVLSHGTWTWIEQPFYKPRFGSRRQAPNGAWLGLTCTAISAMCALALYGYLNLLQQNDSRLAVNLNDYPGALALTPNFLGPQFKRPFIPSALNARYDQADSEKNGCQASYSQSEPQGCNYGVATSTTRVVLVGDSHAEQWLPALIVVAEQRPMAITVYAKAHCAFSVATQFLFEEGRVYKECDEWSRRLLLKLKESPPALLITSEVNGYQVVGSAGAEDDSRMMADGYRSIWKELRSTRIGVFVIKDTPYMPFDVPDCLARRGATIEKCSAPRSAVLRSDDPLAAASGDDIATLIDMNDSICTPEICQAVVGNVLVYQDSNHLTATYARSLAPMLNERIKWDGTSSKLQSNKTIGVRP